ncbi:17381_t:CDS:1, partial [Gigaspora margarita]
MHNIFALECNAGGGNITQNTEADKYCQEQLGPGYVCGNTNPGQNTCYYGCHQDFDCKKPDTLKCDKSVTTSRPHWACRCNSYWDCH